MFEYKLWHNETQTKKNLEVIKWWDLSKLVTNALASLILIIFSAP